MSAGSRRELHDVFELARNTGIRPEVVRYPLERVGDAIDALHNGQIVGRAVVLP
ncbi:hypothetical protein ACQPXH_21360 [Nocardia sp. CA-135953]|uniref:hypothetical protein n=1 Tax=Nocardia sp. CA-135953 TaxID=3239978 RepID=UPI003D9989D5